MGLQRAALGRAFVSHADPPLMDLSVVWSPTRNMFDHELNVQHSVAGTGYSDACRPSSDFELLVAG